MGAKKRGEKKKQLQKKHTAESTMEGKSQNATLNLREKRSQVDGWSSSSPSKSGACSNRMTGGACIPWLLLLLDPPGVKDEGMVVMVCQWFLPVQVFYLFTRGVLCSASPHGVVSVLPPNCRDDLFPLPQPLLEIALSSQLTSHTPPWIVLSISKKERKKRIRMTNKRNNRSQDGSANLDASN